MNIFKINFYIFMEEKKREENEIWNSSSRNIKFNIDYLGLLSMKQSLYTDKDCGF